MTILRRAISPVSLSLKRTIQGPNTGLHNPTGVAVDEMHQLLYVANDDHGDTAPPIFSITVYGLDASGNAAPIRTLQGANTGHGVNNVSPTQTIQGTSTGFQDPQGVALDLEHNEIVVANSFFQNPISNGAILVFQRSDNGNVAPFRTIQGTNTMLCSPIDLTLNPARNELVVANSQFGQGCGQSVTTYAWTPGVSGSFNTAPLRTLSGGVSGLSNPTGVTITDIGDIVLTPHTATNHEGTEHTVTATVSNFDLTPIEGATIEFKVVSGPNAGITGTDISDANGEATFTYTGVGGAGTDGIQASFVDFTGTLQISDPVTKEWIACLIYAVQDPKHVAQFFSIDSYTLAVTAVGPQQPGRNIEAIAIHPTTTTLYATSSKGNRFSQQEFLFTVDKATGMLSPIGPTGLKTAMDVLAFRPTDRTLWGWARYSGLVTINPSTGAARLVLPSIINIQGLTWDNTGTVLYASIGNDLFVYDSVRRTLTRIETNLPGQIRALETRPDGLLAIGIQGSGTVYAYNVITKRVVPAASIPTPYSTIEGIAWPRACTP